MQLARLTLTVRSSGTYIRSLVRTYVHMYVSVPCVHHYVNILDRTYVFLDSDSELSSCNYKLGISLRLRIYVSRKRRITCLNSKIWTNAQSSYSCSVLRERVNVHDRFCCSHRVTRSHWLTRLTRPFLFAPVIAV